MPMVEITVNSRRHSVQCGDGEEARVRGLAAYIDRKIGDLAPGNHQAGDARLILMASLVIADELSDAYDKIKELEARLEGGNPAAGAGVDSERRAAAMIEQVAEQLNAVAVELERA